MREYTINEHTMNKILANLSADLNNCTGFESVEQTGGERLDVIGYANMPTYSSVHEYVTGDGEIYVEANLFAWGVGCKREIDRNNSEILAYDYDKGEWLAVQGIEAIYAMIEAIRFNEYND